MNRVLLATCVTLIFLPFAAVPAKAEHNACPTAHTLLLNTVQVGIVNGNDNEVDTYRFTTTSDARVSLTSYGTGIVRLEVLNSGCTVTCSTTVSISGPCYASQAGTHYVRVTYLGGGGGGALYSLHVTPIL